MQDLSDIDKTNETKTWPFVIPAPIVVEMSTLDPLDKIREPALYVEVLESIRTEGLYNPIIVLEISREEWMQDTFFDKDMLTPPKDGPELRRRVQVGNNRLYALRELGFEYVEAIVTNNRWAAYSMGHYLRVDKRWRRPGNWRPTK